MKFNQIRGILSLLSMSFSLFLLACDDESTKKESADLGLQADLSLIDMHMDMMPQVEVDLQIPDMAIGKCAHPIQYKYDPLNEETAKEMHSYPDDLLTVPDETTNTGRRNRISVSPWVKSTTAFLKKATSQLDELDGWGLNASIVIKFESPLTSVPAQIQDDPMFQLIRLDEETDALDLLKYPKQVPLMTELTRENQALLLTPMIPLKPNTQYGLVVSQNWVFEDQCFEPSPFLESLLDGSAIPKIEGDDYTHLFTKYQKLLEKTQINKEDVAIALVFTTQSALSDSVAIANHIKTQTYQWAEDANCSDKGDYFFCKRKFTANDYRTEGVVRDAVPHSQYDLPVYAWIPKTDDPTQKFPVIIYGHGIGGDCEAGWSVFAMLTSLGIAVVGVDAQEHGIHPTVEAKDANNSAAQVFQFFSLNVQELTLDALKARDNFRGSTFDKLQLVELLFQDGDITGDGNVDVDPTRLGYYGLSLGGIMGVEFLALEDRVQNALLTVPGAHLVKVVSDGEIVRPFLSIFYTLAGGQIYFKSMMPLAQTLLDGADPGTFAPWIHLDRLEGRSAKPNVLQQMAINDQTVPNESNAALARALRLPHLKPVAQSIGIVPEVDGPLMHNIDEKTTGAIFQFEFVSEGLRLRNQPSNHENVPYSLEAKKQYFEFFKSWLQEDGARIIDPYLAE